MPLYRRASGSAASRHRPLAVVEHQIDFLDLRTQRAVLEFEERDNRPSVVVNHPQQLDDWRVAFTKRRAASIVLATIADVQSGDPIVMPSQQGDRAAVGRGE